MKRAAATLGLIAFLVALLGGPAAAATVAARYQLRGHLPELGERPTMRVFVTEAAYDTYRNSLGDANVFPPASALFMSFDKDILALYTRGNDTGGRCIGTQITANFSGDTLAATAPWQPGTCGAPSTAHYPFILIAISRTAADGTAWLPTARSVCLTVESADTNACASPSGGAPAPSATSAPASATPAPTTSATAVPSATVAATATRSLTPSQTVAAASLTPTQTSAPTTATRSPAAAASQPPSAADNGTNYLLYAMLIAIGFLVLLSLFLSRGGRRRR
jgi:hypothetical protein